MSHKFKDAFAWGSAKHGNRIAGKASKAVAVSVLSMLTCMPEAFSAEPSQLIVIRAPDNTLWKATCAASTCSGFSVFPGLFNSQPTVLWDENNQRFVLWGIGLDNQVWRSTFNRTGTFQNDWSVPMPGIAASPPGAAGGGIALNTWHKGTATATAVTSAVTNVVSDYIVCPWDGEVIATASGVIEHDRSSATGTVFARVYLSSTSGGTSSVWAYTDLPPGTTGITSMPFSITDVFTCPADGGQKYVYMTAQEGGGAAATTTTNVRFPALTLQFVPYSY